MGCTSMLLMSLGFSRATVHWRSGISSVGFSSGRSSLASMCLDLTYGRALWFQWRLFDHLWGILRESWGVRHDGCELHRYLRSSQTWTFRCSGRGTIAGFTTPTWMRTWSEPAKVWRSGCTGSSLSSACWAGSSLGCEPTGRKGW